MLTCLLFDNPRQPFLHSISHFITPMSTAFTYPPHPSNFLPQPATRSYPVVTTSKKCSLHDVSIFDLKSLEECTSPVLYLPPLLSSLPEELDFHPQESLADPELPPLATATRLPNIDPASLSLHKALHHFRPLTTDYASAPYPEAFNWEEILLPKMDDRDWYCVAFRSRRKAGSDGNGGYSYFVLFSIHCHPHFFGKALYAADKLAHEEAIRNGGVS